MSKNQTSGRFIWHELHTRDIEAAKGFYGELFGWKAKAVDMGAAGPYTMFSAGDRDVAGATKLQGPAPQWLAYCTTPDVDAAAARAKANGATVLVPATDIPTVGRFAVVSHGSAGTLAPFRSLDERPDADPALGTFCWDELVTQDPAAAASLLTEVFGYTTEARDMGPLGTYTVLKRGDRQAGGIMKAMDPRAPAAWIGYVVVEDVDKSLERAKKLGGKQLVAPIEVPSLGRFAVIADHEGATIALFTGA